MIAALAVLVLVLSLIILGLLLLGAKRFVPLEFMLKSRSAGFDFSEGRRLRDAALFSGLKDPATIFSSPRDLDKAIAVLGTSGREGSKDGGRQNSKFFDKVYALRKKLELEMPRFKSGIRSSRQLGQGQRIRLLIHGLGVFNTTLIDNNSHFLVLSYPQGARLPEKFVWQGKRVSVYFWRREDAGYVFDSFVLDDLRIKSIPVIHVAHSESLLRTQKRKSVRANASIPAYLYLLKRIEGAYEKVEREAGMKSKLADLSEDGFSVVVGGKGRTGLFVKAQFEIAGRGLVMSGTVKSVDYDPGKNRSTLHVEAVKPSPRTRNAIRAYVYGVRSEGMGKVGAKDSESSRPSQSEDLGASV